VGKTQTAKALAGILFDSEENLIRLDMAEFSEKHTMSKLIGAPPGYVGYGEEGQLTGKLRTRPYSVVLLDEIEKAHPEVLNLFLALFDEGRISDARGCLVDCQSCVFVMTSNAGTAGVATPPAGFQNGSGKTVDLKKDMLRAIQKSFALEFLNRTEVVFFKPLSLRDLAVIGRRMIAEADKRFKDRGISLCVEEEALEWVCRQGYDKRFGARHLQRAINDLVLGPVTDVCLADEVPEGSRLTARLKDQKLEYALSEGLRASDDDETKTL
jgi:ATP-dependent Clp protease ATP-binding subunit ClpC